MADQTSPERFKADMPQIPGVSETGVRRGLSITPAVRLVVGLVAVLVVLFLGARWALRPRHIATSPAAPPPQIEVPSPAPDPDAALPHVTPTDPSIATLAEVAKPWSSKEFFMRNGLTGEYVRALLIRLPSGSATQPDGYWAFSLSAPYGNCEMEYVTDLKRLKTEYDFRQGRHPMVGNPCTRTLFNPLKLTNLPGNVWVRGAIAQGSDLRPPLGIELSIRGKEIQAVSME